MTSSVTIAFEAVLKAVANLDPVSLLSHLTLRYLFVRADEFQSESADIHRHQTWIELLTGLLATRPFPQQAVEAISSDAIDIVWQRVQDYFVAVERGLMGSMLGKGFEPGDLNWVLFDARNHSLSIRGDAYRHQFKQMALSLYQEHDEWFRAKLGFTIRQAFVAAEAVMDLPIGWDKPGFTGFVCVPMSEEEVDVDAKSAPGRMTAEAFLGFTATELASVSGLSLETTANILTRLSQEFGYRNPQHPHSFKNPEQAPWDFNTLCERPFLHHDGRYWLFVPPILFSSLFRTFWFDLFSDREYRDTFNPARSRWLEYQVAERLRRVFPSGSVLVNPTKGPADNGEELADVLVLHDRKVLIVQCKSKGLTHDARVGLNARQLIADVRNAVADAFGQAIDARSYMTRGQKSIILYRGCEIHVPREAVTGFYLLTVTPLPLQFFTTRLANNGSVADLFGGNEFPWAVSLPDLDAITEVLPSPARFLNYASQRIAMERAPFRLQGDEMDMLGVYLSAGLRMDDPDYAGAHVVCFAGMSTGVDEYVWKRHDQEVAAEPPAQFSPPGFAELIRDIERSGCLDAMDCAMILLDSGGKARVNLMEAMREAKEKCRQTGKLHRAALIMKNGSVGVSLVALDSKGDRDNFQRQFEAHSTLLKHAARCNTWVGMAWDRGSARNIDLCLFLSEEWHANSTLDDLAAQYGLSKWFT